MKSTAIREHVVLDSIQIHSIERITEAAARMHHRDQPIRSIDSDMIQIRHMIRGWGRTARVELSCPATWWDHLKHAMRARWPRLFGRLVVRMDIAIAENGAIVAGLAPIATAKQIVIPYAVPTGFRSFIDDPSKTDEP